MSLTYRFNRLFVLLAWAICLPAMAEVSVQTEPTPTIVTAKIKLDDLSMIIVPVSINGSGPYDFLLDTGASRTMLDQKLADDLALPRMGNRTVVGVLASTAMRVVHANSLSVGGAAISGMDLSSSEHRLIVSSKVRGVLGEDFLQHFDVLIDYRHQIVQFESATGALAETASGERLPLQLSGTYRGQPTHNRLVISGHIAELGGQSMSLLLDSGVNYLTLFQDPGLGATPQESARAGNFNSWNASPVATRTVRSLQLGSNSVPDLTAIALSRRADVDTDGLVPTSLFHSIFISHRGGFAILNPSFPRQSR